MKHLRILAILIASALPAQASLQTTYKSPSLQQAIYQCEQVKRSLQSRYISIRKQVADHVWSNTGIGLALYTQAYQVSSPSDLPPLLEASGLPDEAEALRAEINRMEARYRSACTNLL